MLTKAIVILAVWHGSTAPVEAVHGSMESCQAAAEEVLVNARAISFTSGDRYRVKVAVACVPGFIWTTAQRGGGFR